MAWGWQKINPPTRVTEKPQFPVEQDALNEFSQFQMGQMGQDLAEKFLQAKGLKTLERNFRTKRGEIDLIMQDQSSMVFVEVKSRNNRNIGGGEEAVHQEKQKRLSILALHYMQIRKKSHQRARFDVLTVALAQDPPTIRWYPNAFEMVSLD